MSDYAEELFTLIDCRGTAEWRRRTAERFPEDPRNTVASELLDALAEEMERLEGSDLHQDVVRAYARALGDGNFHSLDDLSNPIAIVNEQLRSVGFGYSPSSAAVFIEDTIELLLMEAKDTCDAGAAIGR